MFKIWYMLIILYFLLLCAVHMMQGFIYGKMLKGHYNYSQDRSFLKGNEENPALVLSNVHNRISARDGPMFGSMGPSMNTSSLTRALLHFSCKINVDEKFKDRRFLDPKRGC
jgi:hypothetical protein